MSAAGNDHAYRGEGQGPTEAADPDARSLLKRADRGGTVLTWFLVRMTGFPISLLDEIQVHDVETDERFWDELAGRIGRLFRREQGLMAAIALSSPGAHEGVSRLMAAASKQGKKTRSRCLVAVKYLQRFCTKNEMAGFFGPHYWGTWDEIRRVPGVQRPEQLRRRSYLSHWAANLLAETLSEGRGRRWKPLVRVGPDRIERMDFRNPVPPWAEEYPHPLPASSDEALEDWTESVYALSAGVIDTVGTLKRQFHDRRPGENGRGLKFLQEVEGLETCDIGEIPDRFASIRQSFVALTGQAASRGMGLHYQDRHACFLEASPTWDRFSMGKRDKASVEKYLLPFVRLLCVIAVARWQVKQQMLREWCTQRFGSSHGAVALSEFVRRYQEDALVLEETILRRDEACLHQWGEWLADVLLGDAGLRLSATVVCDPDALLEAGDRALRSIRYWRPIHCNVDVLFCDDWSPVFGEMHWLGEEIAEVTCSESAPEEFLAEVRAASELAGGPGTTVVRPIFRTRSKANVFRTIGLHECEITGTARIGTSKLVDLWKVDLLWNDESVWLESQEHGKILLRVSVMPCAS